MNRKLFKKVALLSVFFATMVSCTVENGSAGVETGETVMSLSTNQVLPGDAVRLKSNTKILSAEIEVFLNEKVVKAYAIDDYNYVFILPVINSGDYILKVPAKSGTYDLMLNVGEYDAISNPDDVITDYVLNREKRFETIKNTSSFLNEKELLISQISEEWDYQFNQASEKDKELLAYLLQRQTIDPDWFTSETDLPFSYYVKGTNELNITDSNLLALAKAYFTAHNFTVSSIPVNLYILIGSF